MKTHVIIWDGEHLPRELQEVPPGRYALKAADEDVSLTPAEDKGIADALRQLDAGQGKSLAVGVADIRRRGATA